MPPSGYARQAGGDQLPFASRAVAHRNHVLPVRLAPGRRGDALPAHRVGGNGGSPGHAVAAGCAVAARPGQLRARSACISACCIGLLLYNLLLFTSVRDVGYLIYVAFVASMGIGQAALTGLGAQFLWPQWTWWNGVSPPVGLAAAAMFGLLFARHFLSSSVRMRVIDKFLLVQLAGWALSLLAALTLPYTVSSWMVTMLAVVSVVTMVVVGCHQHPARVRRARGLSSRPGPCCWSAW